MEFNIESPFSFDLGEELFPLPSLPPSIDIYVPQLKPSISPSLDQNNNSVSKNPKKNGCRRKTPAANTSDNIGGGESPNEQKKKKIVHRDVERQRRQEMSSLYSNLRSLIPLEYLKGKRSISDHMEETVKYIQHMQNKIQQLSDKRDELKKLSHKNVVVASTVQTLSSSKRDSVMVRAKTESKGVQVIIDTGTQNMNLVSNILQALTVDGLEILSCISTKINQRFIHTIECQVVVNDGRYQNIDVSELQHKLMNLEYCPLD